MKEFATIDMPPSLWKLYTGHGKHKAKSKEYLAWRNVAYLQLISQKKLIGYHGDKFKITLVLCRIRKNCDLDNYIKPVLDLLQSSGVILDDKHCEEINVKWHHLKERVCMFMIEEVK